MRFTGVLCLIGVLLAQTACFHKRIAQDDSSGSMFAHLVAQPREGLPLPDPTIQKALMSVLDVGKMSGKDSAEQWFCNLGKVARLKTEGSRSSEEWMQQILLLNAQFLSADSGEGAWYMLRACAVNAEQFLQILPEAYLAGVAPSLESEDHAVATAAEELLKGSRVLNPYVGFGNAQSYHFYDVAKYVDKRGANDVPWKLIALAYRVEKKAAFETFDEMCPHTSDEGLAAWRQMAELEVLYTSQVFAIGDAAAVAESKKKIAEKLSEIGKSPDWPKRMYVVELLPYAWENDDIAWALAERLANDPNPMISARAKEKLDDRKSNQKRR